MVPFSIKYLPELRTKSPDRIHALPILFTKCLGAFLTIGGSISGAMNGWTSLVEAYADRIRLPFPVDVTIPCSGKLVIHIAAQ
jgi:hypothetical protein